MYIHGYGSNGSAMKGQLLREMLPQCRVISPTFDYDNVTPWKIQEQIREVAERECVDMLVGSSFGGYHSLCATAFFRGPVWTINPVHDVIDTIRRIVVNGKGGDSSDLLNLYNDFDNNVFRHQVQLNQSGQWPADTPLNFALSADDELLGDHKPLLDLFPCHNRVVWKERSGHRFLRFEELDLLS